MLKLPKIVSKFRLFTSFLNYKFTTIKKKLFNRQIIFVTMFMGIHILLKSLIDIKIEIEICPYCIIIYHHNCIKLVFSVRVKKCLNYMQGVLLSVIWLHLFTVIFNLQICVLLNQLVHFFFFNIYSKWPSS